MSDRPNDAGSPVPTIAQPGRILQLADFSTMQPARIMADMRDYWDTLRGGRAVPARSDIQPQGIHRALDYAFILERISPGAARFRLAGQHLINLMGMEVRGMAFCSLAKPSSRGRLSDVLESVFRAPQLAQMTLHAEAEYARPELSARMLLLPLTSDLGDVTRALGCIIAEGQIGIGPRRFDLTADEVMPIVAGGKTIAPSASGFDPSVREGEQLRPVSSSERLIGSDRPQRREESPESRRKGFRVISVPQTHAPKGFTKT